MRTAYVIPAAAGIGIVSALFARSHPGWMAPLVMGGVGAYLWTRKGSATSAPAGQWSYAGAFGLLAGAAYGAVQNIVDGTSQSTGALGSALTWPGHPNVRYDWQQIGGGEKPISGSSFVQDRYYSSARHPYLRKGGPSGRPLP
jgi:hypothetical protein